MKTSFTLLCALALSISISTLGHAAAKCALEKRAYDRAVVDYNRAEQQYTRLQFQVDTRSEQGEYRRAILEGNVETARGNLNAAQQGAIGQGLGCLLAPRPTCIGPTVNRVSQQIARAKAQLKAQDGRLNAFVRAHQTQMTRLSQRVTQQETLLRQKQSVLDSKESAYQACMTK
jgi:hypothetical protein